jgi:hypothetical protein
VEKEKYSDHPISRVNLNHVVLTDAFWLPKIQTVLKKTIKYAFDKCNTEGKYENFIIYSLLRMVEPGHGKNEGLVAE